MRLIRAAGSVCCPAPREDARPSAAGLFEAAALDHRARSQASSLSLLELDGSPVGRALGTGDGIRLDESRIRHYLHAYAYSLLRPVLTVASPDPEYDSKRARIEGLQRQVEAGTIDLYKDNPRVAQRDKSKQVAKK